MYDKKCKVLFLRDMWVVDMGFMMSMAMDSNTSIMISHMFQNTYMVGLQRFSFWLLLMVWRLLIHKL